MKTRIHATASVSSRANIGKGCSIGPYALIEAGVELGDNSTVGGYCHLGHPYQGKMRKNLKIGPGALIRSHSVLYGGSIIGPGLHTGHHACIREFSNIGARFQLGSFGDVQGFVRIGSDVRTQSHVYICQHSTIEDYVWLFPGAMLANDPHPPSDVCTKGPTLRKFSVVGMGAIVLAHVTVGEGSVIGAGAVVSHDVAEGDLVIGVPARVVGKARDVRSRHSSLSHVYPWRVHFKRGYPFLKDD